MKDTSDRKTFVALLSVVSNTTLVMLKVVVGLLIGSVSVISEAIHSAVDLLASIIALMAVRVSARPPDEGHPFGHGKVENLSGTVEAALIFLAAGWIVFESVKKLLHPEPLETVGWGVAVMCLSAILNWVVSSMLFKVGAETDSVALQADAWHLRTDVYTSAGVMLGLMAIWLGHLVAPGRDFRWIDPLAAIGVACLIVKAAYDLTVESARDLLDVALPAGEEELIREHIVAFAPAVRGIHDLRTRKAGADRFVEFHMLVEASVSTRDSHEMTRAIARAIKEHYPATTVTIHVEPCDGLCTPKCTDGCLLDEEGRCAIRKSREARPAGRPPD